ncbi:PIN/TRAM domain-containing protein [Cohnella sp. AR92]|uniref:PIN/TRAM domain-containing protein n=1 Tax=Cohnella sp. AR92 TaxID=648716 RepID=UPI000F8EA73D|nr:PIN/TRAM domain-containing protein [Cohnella sp. AR92]RUS44312.1 PIN/TRAM domain-containing protein [Cohnella sp. AR92]
MMKRIIQAVGVLLGAMMGQSLFAARLTGGSEWMNPLTGASSASNGGYLGAAVGAVIGLFAASALAGPLAKALNGAIERMSGLPPATLLSGLFGAGTGLVLAALLYPYLGELPRVGGIAAALAALTLCYAGVRIGTNKKDDLTALLQSRQKPAVQEEEEPRREEHKILDTSVIIDGRIADICKTGFIEGTLVIPEFVLEELQHIADSSDLLKRNRGRRGLDILNKIQKELDVRVLIYEEMNDEPGEVDSKLVKLAKAMHGKVVTNDFNLNKVCELQGVSVLNINDLANAVKPVVLPGEEIVVQVIKDGKEHGQGVAYLDDGTMIVVEGGRDFIGTTMEVLVTSVLQTSAGRMIFAKPKLLEKAL